MLANIKHEYIITYNFVLSKFLILSLIGRKILEESVELFSNSEFFDTLVFKMLEFSVSKTSGNVEYSGWDVDDVIIVDSRLVFNESSISSVFALKIIY